MEIAAWTAAVGLSAWSQCWTASGKAGKAGNPTRLLVGRGVSDPSRRQRRPCPVRQGLHPSPRRGAQLVFRTARRRVLADMGRPLSKMIPNGCWFLWRAAITFRRLATGGQERHGAYIGLSGSGSTVRRHPLTTHSPITSTMQDDFPLTITTILRHGSTVYGHSECVTWLGDRGAHASYAEIEANARRLAAALPARRQRRGPGGHVLLEQPGAPGGVLRDAVHGRGAAHAEHPAARRAAHAHRQPRRGQDHHRRRHPAAAAGAGAAAAHHGRGVHRGRRRRRLGPRATGRVLRYERAAGRPRTPASAGPSWTRRRPRSMCYTSGTTGDPKGVVYSHRSTFLHALSGQAATLTGATEGDRILHVVPMFHVNAWGIPFAAFMAGATLHMPGPYMTAAGPAPSSRAERPTLAAAVPTIWQASSGRRDSGDRPVLAADGHVRRRGDAALADGGLPGALRPEDHPGLGDDRDLARWAAWLSRRRRRARHRGGAGLADEVRPDHRGGRDADRRRRAGQSFRGTASSVGEIEVRGPWITARYYRRRRRRTSSTTAGCGPGTSAPSTTGATSRSPTARRTSSSPAASGSPRSSWKTCSPAAPACSKPPSSGSRTRNGPNGRWPAWW